MNTDLRMDNTLSISKGCFVYKNGATHANRNRKKSKIFKNYSFIDIGDDEHWYTAYRNVWNNMETKIENLLRDNYCKVLEKLIDFLRHIDRRIYQDLFPSIVLLTGINQPDHDQQFESLANKIREENRMHCVILPSRDCPNVKSAVETLVSGFLNFEDDEQKVVKRSQCNMQSLLIWYFETYGEQCLESYNEPVLAIIIPDFELFNKSVLQDVVAIVSSHRSVLPLVIIFGVATSVSALDNALPFNFTSKAKFDVFQSQPSIVNLNQILEKTVLHPSNSIHLSGKTLKLLLEIFLFFDFSIKGFVQGLKFCVMEHYSQGNVYGLCTNYENSLKILPKFSHEDLESIRQLMSMRRYIESLENCNHIIAMITDDEFFRKSLKQLLAQVHVYLYNFYCGLQALHSLVRDLPKFPLGKQLRELYCHCASNEVITDTNFNECWHLLAFTSQEEFLKKLNQMTNLMKKYLKENEIGVFQKNVSDQTLKIVQNIEQYSKQIEIASTEKHNEEKINESFDSSKMTNRLELKEKFLEMFKQQPARSLYSELVSKCLNFIKEEIIAKFLVPFHKGPPLIELFVYSDSSAARRHIVGAPRAALHQALQNPHFYLQCKCCDIAPSALTQSQPDISIAYKLHLECGRMINLFDWLQAFKSVVDDDEEQTDNIDPQIQARFSRAVAELQFLGFIKSSKRKTDHVARLTW